MHTSILTLAIVAGALAVPNSSPKCTLYDDNYDGLSTIPGLPESSPVGDYHGLVYSDFDVSQITPGTNGFLPHSKPNVAIASINQDLLSLNLGITPFGTITTGSGVKSFDLRSFYFACGDATANTLVGVAESCTLAVTGYYAKGGQAPEATFAFANTNAPNNAMVLAELPLTYVGLKNVTIGVANGAVTTATTIIAVDDLVHCNYS